MSRLTGRGGKSAEPTPIEVVEVEDRQEAAFGRTLPKELAKRGITEQGWDMVFERLDHAGRQGAGFFNPAGEWGWAFSSPSSRYAWLHHTPCHAPVWSL